MHLQTRSVVIAFLEVFACFAFISIFCMYGIWRIRNTCSICVRMVSLGFVTQVLQRTKSDITSDIKPKSSSATLKFTISHLLMIINSHIPVAVF